MLPEENASIDVRQMRDLLSKIPAQNPAPETLVPQSPPRPNSPRPAPSKPGVEHVPSSLDAYHSAHVQLPPPATESHDQSGDLHLSYSNPFSQLGSPTQVDSSSLLRRCGAYGSVETTQRTQRTQESQQSQPPSRHAADPIGHDERVEPHSSSVGAPETAPESFETVPSTAPEDLPQDERNKEKDGNEERDADGKDREDEENEEEKDEANEGEKDGGEDAEDNEGKDGEIEDADDQDKDEEEEDADDQDKDEEDEDARSGFPMANRFGGADSQLSTPAKPNLNPLAHIAMGIGAGTGLSMTQVFNAESSPMDRTRAIDSQPPPTPSYSAAKMMARSMPLAPTVWDEYSSPARRGGRGTTEPPEFPRLANFDSPARRTGDMMESPLRRPKSPVPFSSPPVLKTHRAVKSDSEDDIFSESQERRMRVVAKINATSAKKKPGEPQFQKSSRLSSAEVNALRPVKPPKKKSSKEFEKPTKTAARRVVVIDDDDETGDDTAAESQGQPVLPQRTSSRDDGVKASKSAAPAPTTQVRASPPIEHPPKQPPPKTQPPPPPLDTAWDELHAPPPLPARSMSYSGRRRTQASPDAMQRHTNSMPVDVDAAPPMTRTGSGQDPVSLSQLVPFNVPALPPTPPERSEKAVPEFVRESSGLTPLPPVQVPRSSLTPNPSSPASDRRGAIPPLPTLQPMVPATSPLRPEGGSPKKRRRKDDAEETPRPQSTLKSFASLNSSQPVLSGVEDPDEVDMIDIVGSVGAGNQPEMEMPAPPPTIQKGRARKKRKTSVDRSVAVEEPREEVASATEEAVAAPQEPEPPRLPSSSPPPVTPIPARTARKGRASTGRSLASKVTKTTSRRRTLTRQTQASMASPTPMVTDCDEDTDILASNHPAFSIAPSPGGPITAPHRVFALWKDHNLQYHPATIRPNEAQGGKIRVIFDDCSSCDLEPQCIRSLDLRVGDIVRVDLPHMKKGTWVIRGFPDPTIGSLNDTQLLTDIRGHTVVAVAPKNSDPSFKTQEVMVTSIYLIKSLWSQFAGRATAFPQPPTTPAFLSTATNTPTHRTHSSTPAKTVPAGIFTGMVFALTFGDFAREKSQIETKLLTHGARIVNIGFEELFHDIDTNPHLQLLPSSQALGFTAVIANGFSRRAKFLQALALGLPCLAARWVEDCVKKGRILDWECYLLPAGESKYLGGVVRSRTLLPASDPVTAKLQDIATRKQIFEGWDVLAVGKGMTKEKMKAFTFLMLAAGADQVERVKTLDAADKRLNERHWHAIFVATSERGATVAGRDGKRKGVRVLDDEEVIQSLILGRLVE